MNAGQTGRPGGLTWRLFLIPAFGLLLIAAVWAATLQRLSVDREAILRVALRETETTADAFEQQVVRAVKEADRWTLRVKYEFEGSAGVNLEEMMSKSLLVPEEINRVSVANAAGDVTSNTRDLKPLNVGDRSYFRRHLGRDSASMDISEPIMSRSSGEQTVVLTRRLNAEDGSFAGVVAISARPSYFTGSFQYPQLGKRGGVSVIGYDGDIGAWHVSSGEATIVDGGEARLLALSRANPAGSFQSTLANDGTERIVAYRALAHYPLVVAVSQSTVEVLESFKQQRTVYLEIASVASVVIAGFFAVLTGLALRLNRRGEEIRAQQGFLMTLVDNLPVGVTVRDARAASFGKLVLLNNTAETILGISRDAAVGKTAHEFFPSTNAARIEQRDRNMVANPAVQHYNERVSGLPGRDERHLNVVRAPIFDGEGHVEYIISITTDVTLEQERADTARLASKVFETTTDAIILSDAQDRVIMVNAAFSRIMGIEPDAMLGRLRRDTPFNVTGDLDYEARLQTINDTGHSGGEVSVQRSAGGPLPCWLSASCVRDADGEIVNYIRVFTDISQIKSSQQKLEALAKSLSDANSTLTDQIGERTRAAAALRRSNDELKEINIQLHDAKSRVLQSEKLASIGQLAAGVAHEINNPIGYVLSNLGTLEGYLDDLFRMISAYEAAEGTLSSETTVAALTAVRELIELDYLKKDIPTLMAESREGISRVRKIVENLKDFSRTDRNQQWVFSNLHSGIDSTLNIVNSEIKYKADVVKEYGEIPDIECLPTQLNQVFMNLLVNAAQAIDKPRGRIVIRSGVEGEGVWVEVADDGSGMPPEVQSRIFDPFYTSKPVGKGTGLGLSLAYGIIQKHNGTIDVKSKVGEGTTFRVWLPLRHASDAAATEDRGPLTESPLHAVAA